jgi:hypothetical protein
MEERKEPEPDVVGTQGEAGMPLDLLEVGRQ